jgi:FAD/FMN-containing dehydrogenase
MRPANPNPNRTLTEPNRTPQRFGYHDASCFGHALEGNLHLVFSQGFRTKEEVQRFSNLMEEMCHIVANKHSGSLKGEHGTGRNVAPFVEMEWGSKAYELMWELKSLFDPNFVLNPGGWPLACVFLLGGQVVAAVTFCWC